MDNLEKRAAPILLALKAANAPLDSTQTRADDIYPYEDELEIKWYNKNGTKTYFIACGKCGEKRLRLWDNGNGLRCKQCHWFHSFISFLRLQERVHKLSRFNDGKIEEIKQPEIASILKPKKVCEL